MSAAKLAAVVRSQAEKILALEQPTRVVPPSRCGRALILPDSTFGEVCELHTAMCADVFHDCGFLRIESKIRTSLFLSADPVVTHQFWPARYYL